MYVGEDFYLLYKYTSKLYRSFGRRKGSDPMRKPEEKIRETKSPKGNFKRVIKRIFIVLCIFFVLSGAVIAGATLGFIDNSTDLIAQEYNLDFTSVVYYIDEETNQPVEYDRMYAEQNRIWVDIENTPEMLRKAFVAIEDERFEKHHGVDWKRTLGATVSFLFKGNSSYGGSTITQQLIKNVTGENERSPIRKIQEIVRALNLEQKMSKDQIIEMYMNTIYLGQGCHGVQTASNVYFSKDVSELSLAECASIAGITQYPSRYDPLLNYEAHKEKQETVLKKMLELEFITQEEFDQAISEELKLVKGTAKTEKTKIQSYYTDQIILDVMNDLMTRNKMSESAATKAIFKGGLKIYSTIDPKIQSAMEEIFSNDNNFPGGGSTKPQSAMVVLDPYTGHVKGLVGGRGEKTGNRVLNRATQSLRQPGSSIKPIAVYAPAIESGIISPATMVADTPITIGDWSPRNSDNDFMGPVTVRVAIERSRNIPAVRVLDKLTVDDSFDFMTKNLGFTTLVSAEKREDGKTYSDKYLSSLGLGGLTDGVSVLEMTAAYAPFVNQGIYTKPITYTKVIDSSGRVILENKPESHRAMSETTAYSMAHMLSGVVKSGTGTAARLANGVFAGGKTGTTTRDIDRWFAGFTPNYVGVVWFGYDSPKSMSGLGNPCVSIWKRVMDSIHQDVTVNTLVEPQNIVSRVICQASGKIATQSCGNTRTDYFKSGTQPSRFCSSHQAVLDDSFSTSINSTDKGLNTITPGSGANNPPAEGDVILPPSSLPDTVLPVDPTKPGEPTDPNSSPDVPTAPPENVPVVPSGPSETTPAPSVSVPGEGQSSSLPENVPVTDDESQYWWSGDE